LPAIVQGENHEAAPCSRPRSRNPEAQGQAVTDEAIEREASILAEGLFVERPEDEIALTARALFESGAEPLSCDQPSRDGIHEDDPAVSQVER
jgi:hypothetical protein